ncbi:MAG: hypothetical protein ABL921_06975 [Pirellula sp.]
MLRSDYERTFNQLIEEHPPTMLLPRHMQLELERRGTDQTHYVDVRIAPRFRCMGQAVIECVESPIALPLQFPMSQGIVRNVSRTGFSLLVDRQWFPEQIGRAYLPIAIAMVRVVRARRLGIRCYDIGLRVIQYQQFS